MIVQLNPYIAVKTPLGNGDTILVIDYGHHTNTVWVVRLSKGVIKHFWSDDIIVYGNPMDGEGWDI